MTVSESSEDKESFGPLNRYVWSVGSSFSSPSIGENAVYPSSGFFEDVRLNLSLADEHVRGLQEFDWVGWLFRLR